MCGRKIAGVSKVRNGWEADVRQKCVKTATVRDMEPSDAISGFLQPQLRALGFATIADGDKSNGYWAFQRGGLKIALALDPRNRELGISLIDVQTERLIEFWLFGEMIGDEKAAKMGSIVLENGREAEVLTGLALIIARHIQVLSNWNAELAESLFSRQLEIGDALWQEERLAAAIKLADGCWRVKDYAKLVQLLTPFAERLTPATMKKVEYARARLSSDGASRLQAAQPPLR